MGKDVKQKRVECSGHPHYPNRLSRLSIYSINHRLVGKSKLMVSKFLSVHIVIVRNLQKNNPLKKKRPTASIPEEP